MTLLSFYPTLNPASARTKNTSISASIAHLSHRR